MQRGTVALDFSLLAAALLGCMAAGVATAQLAEFGIEGMGVVSTAASEVQASISPDGQRIVWASDRADGWDLWQATLDGNRWRDPRPLPVNTDRDDLAPAFSADGHWLYFASDRAGGHGGHDLYRAAVQGDGFGPIENLGSGINSAADERAAMPDRTGTRLLFASDGHGGAGGFDVFVARVDAAVAPRALAGINTAADETGAAWLVDGVALVFSRESGGAPATSRLHLARCDGQRYAVAPLLLSFNTVEAWTAGPAIDWHAPGELLVSGTAKAPRAGKLDIYRMKAPTAVGKPGCV